MFLIFAIAVIALIISYLKMKYFSVRGSLPAVPPQFIFGNLLQSGLLFGGKTLAEVFLDYKTRFGDIFQFYISTTRLIVVSNADDVQHIFAHRNIYDQSDVNIQLFGSFAPSGLICTKGAKYKRHACIIVPLFRRARIVSNFNLIVSSTDKLLDKWKNSPKDKIHVDISRQCHNLLIATFGLIAFDYDLQTLEEENAKTKNELSDALQKMLITLRIIAYLPPTLMRTYLRWNPQYQKVYKIIESYINRIVDEQQKQSPEIIAEKKRTSLIASLVTALQVNETVEGEKSEEDRKGLSRSELIDEMILFFVAGTETASTAMSWFIYFMSKNPQVQQKIKEELIQEGQKEALLEDHFNSLSYLDCVIKEVLRLCPVIDATSRTLTVDDRLPICGVQMRKGDTIMIPIHNLAMDSRYWSIDPNVFCPERFLNEDRNHHPYVFIPFGSGHRQCAGQDLARFELKLIAARLMQM